MQVHHQRESSFPICTTEHQCVQNVLSNQYTKENGVFTEKFVNTSFSFFVSGGGNVSLWKQSENGQLWEVHNKYAKTCRSCPIDDRHRWKVITKLSTGINAENTPFLSYTQSYPLYPQVCGWKNGGYLTEQDKYMFWLKRKNCQNCKKKLESTWL